MAELRRRFLRAYTLELRLLMLNWIYPVMHGLLFFVLRRFSVGYDVSAQAMLETTLGRLAIGLTSLVGLFAAGLSASRARRARMAELEQTYPTGEEVLLGRWLAGVTALLTFAIEPLILAGRLGPLTSLWAGMPTFLTELTLTLAFTTAAAWALVMWLRPGRWAYPLLAAGWMGFMLGPAIIGDRFPYMGLLNFMRQGASYYSELWRRHLYRPLPLWFNLFYGGLLLLLLAWVAWTERTRRFRRPSLTAAALGVVALAVTSFAGVRYVAAVNVAQVPPDTAATPHQSTPAPLIIGEDYNLDLDLSDPTRPRFTAVVTVRNVGDVALDVLQLSLHATLEIVEANLPFERAGATVRFALPAPLAPGATQTVRVIYTGSPDSYGRDDGLPVLETFAGAAGIRLTPAVAWYPVPVGAPVHPAQVRLTVTGTTMPVAANIPTTGPNTFTSQGTTWLFVIGSPHLVTAQIGEITLITARHDLARARELASMYADALTRLRRCLPNIAVEGLTLMILGEESGLPEGTPPSDGRAVVVISRPVLAAFDRPSAYNFPLVWDALIFDLWRIGGGDLGGHLTPLVRETAHFIWMTDYYEGDIADLTAEVDRRLQQMPSDSHRASLTRHLLDLYTKHGEAGVDSFLSEIHARSNELSALSDQELQSWWLEAINAR